MFQKIKRRRITSNQCYGGDQVREILTERQQHGS